MNQLMNNRNNSAIKELPPVHPLNEVSSYGVKKAEKSKLTSFGLSIFAGAFIAIAFIFYITVTTGSDGSSWGISRLAGGIAFSLGLILVVVSGAELFTSTVLSSVAWAQGKLNTKQLLSCWGRVYLGNFIGAMLILLLVFGAKMHQLDHGSWGINALQIAQHKLHHTWLQAFSLGVLCNLLVCLGIWMTFSSRDMLTKSLLLVLPVAMFVSSGFEHSIANMFMVPLGIVIQNTASPEFFSALGFSTTSFSDLTINHFIYNNLIPVTLGNIVGGAVMVGLGYWLTYKKVPETISNNLITEKQPSITNASSISTYLQSLGESTMKNSALAQLTVSSLMDTQAVTLTVNESASAALSQLAEYKVRGAAVINDQQSLVGFVSEQDLLRAWWSNDFELDNELTVKDVMQTEVLSVTPEQSIAELIEFMTVDKSVLFPVSDSGVLLSTQYLTFAQRLNKAAAKRPSIYPVIENGLVVATITRQHISNYLLKAMLPNVVKVDINDTTQVSTKPHEAA